MKNIWVKHILGGIQQNLLKFTLDPKSLKDLGSNVRAITDLAGNLFVNKPRVHNPHRFN